MEIIGRSSGTLNGGLRDVSLLRSECLMIDVQSGLDPLGLGNIPDYILGQPLLEAVLHGT